jgi:hypothetical protein
VAYHHWCCGFESQHFMIKWLATGQWFSLGPPVSPTNETDRHDIAEILLKVALNTIKQTIIEHQSSDLDKWTELEPARHLSLFRLAHGPGSLICCLSEWSTDHYLSDPLIIIWVTHWSLSEWLTGHYRCGSLIIIWVTHWSLSEWSTDHYLSDPLIIIWVTHWSLSEWLTDHYLSGPLIIIWVVHWSLSEWPTNHYLSGPLIIIWVTHWSLSEWSTDHYLSDPLIIIWVTH